MVRDEADARQHQHGAGDARDAGIDLGLAHAHAGVADAHVGQHGRLEGRARRDAVERRQAGLIEIADGIVEVAPGLEPVGAVAAGLEFLGLVEILAGREGAVAGSGHDHRAHARIRVPAAQHLGDLRPHGRVPGVELPRLVERDGGDPSVTSVRTARSLLFGMRLGLHLCGSRHRWPRLRAARRGLSTPRRHRPPCVGDLVGNWATSSGSNSRQSFSSGMMPPAKRAIAKASIGVSTLPVATSSATTAPTPGAS